MKLLVLRKRTLTYLLASSFVIIVTIPLYIFSYYHLSITSQERLEIQLDSSKHLAKGPLPWEDNSDFKKLCIENNAIVRMSAFKIDLPDLLSGGNFNIDHGADLLAGKVVQPGTVFSLNASVGPYSKERGYREGPSYHSGQVKQTEGGGICKLAAALFNAAILADLTILERHAHSMVVPYVPPGQDAAVTFLGGKDLKFKNVTQSPLVIWSDTVDKTLFVAVYGIKAPDKVSWHHKVLNRQKTSTVYHRNDSLGPGETRVVIPGADGLTVKSWLLIEPKNDKPYIKELGIDHYQPLPQLIEHNPQ